jgi:hypothetical protein
MAVALAAAALVSGCGSDGGGGDAAKKPPPVARPEDFPKPAGRSLEQIARHYGGGGPTMLRSSAEFSLGRNRFGFGLFDRARAQITNATAAVYVGPPGKGPARGPFPARWESLAVKPQFLSRGVQSDPNAAKSVYVADVKLGKTGHYQAIALLRLDDRLVLAPPGDPGFTAAKRSVVPNVGDKPPPIHTPTRTDVGGDLAKIDTRAPPSTMHDVDFADVVGKKPVVLLFATPLLCKSRVCGPVVDVAEQVKSQHSDDVAFIHMEIYNDNNVDHGFRPQVTAWHLPTEPWLFTINRKGRIAARIEGAFGADDLERAIRAAQRG